MTASHLLRAAAVAGLAVLAPTHAKAQFFAFGQNKIQYRELDWRVLKGPHVDLYYYPEETDLAGIALDFAEATYDTLRLKFGHDVPTRVPLIIYASHIDFSQTNILPFIPPEGILGVTDFAKHRVTMPFRGSLAEFFATLRHEMVHVFQFSIATQDFFRSPRLQRAFTPLWWSEGLAEWWSGGQDARDEMIVRDLVLSGRLPSFRELTYASGGLEYALGGRIHRWLAETYGDWRVEVFYREFWRYLSFQEAIQAIYGKPLEELSDEFALAMKRTYNEAVLTREPLSVAGQRLAARAVSPSYIAGTADSAARLVYLSASNGYISIVEQAIGTTGDKRKIISGGRSEDYESLHPFSSRIDASRQGYLVFSSQRGDRDALVIWHLARHELAGRYQFEGVTSILSPAWAADSASIFFSGLSDGGISDLYRVWLPDGRLEKLTTDLYQDLDPAPSPDGVEVVFASDRTADGLAGAKNLFAFDLGTGAIRQLTSGPWVDETPRFGADGRIYFASDRDGILNIFSMDRRGFGRRETSAWSGAFDPSYVPERGGVLVSGYQDRSLNVYYLPADPAAHDDTFAPPLTIAEHSTWRWPTSPEYTEVASNSEPYRRKLTVDIAAAEAVAIPGFGSAQGAAILLSDLLNDDLVFASLATYSGPNFSDIFDNFNVSGIYINQRHRLNWGIGGFRSNGNIFEAGSRTASYQEKTVGGLALVRYPLNRFNRFEGQLQVEYSDRFDFTLPVDDPRRTGWIVSNFASFVRDNSLWTPAGPIDGGRFAVTVGVSNDLSNARFDSYLLSADWRRYLRLGSRSAYAVRALGWYSGGDRPRRINLGGTHAIRGFPLFGAVTGSQAWMLNQELRFPLLNFLTLGTPVGPIRFPEFQGALFFDLGQARFSNSEGRTVLGSAGAGVRWALWPFAVLRLDVGRRFGSGFDAYQLGPNVRPGSFAQVWFGFDY